MRQNCRHKQMKAILPQCQTHSEEPQGQMWQKEVIWSLWNNMGPHTNRQSAEAIYISFKMFNTRWWFYWFTKKTHKAMPIQIVLKLLSTPSLNMLWLALYFELFVVVYVFLHHCRQDKSSNTVLGEQQLIFWYRLLSTFPTIKQELNCHPLTTLPKVKTKP